MPFYILWPSVSVMFVLSVFLGVAAPHADAEKTPIEVSDGNAEAKTSGDKTTIGAKEGAPYPHEAHGILIPRTPKPRPVRNLARGLLYVPRRVLELALLGPRIMFWAYEYYDLRERFFDVFFNDDRTIGLFPSVFFETGVGLNAGVHFVHRNFHKMKIHMRAGWGLNRRQDYWAKATRELWAQRAVLQLTLGYRVRPNARFFGIGNGTLEPATMSTLIDPTSSDTAVATRFRYNDVIGRVGMGVSLSRRFSLEMQGKMIARTFRDNPRLGDDAFIGDIYDTARLTGYDNNLLNISAALQAVYDTRTVAASALSPTLSSSGSFLSSSISYQHGVGDDPSQFLRVGGQVHRWIDIYRADRVLVLGVHFEAIFGKLSDIPFVDLVALGGTERLRGFHRNRFRDRIGAVGTVEYNFPVQEAMSMYTFVDAGRVWRDLGSVGLHGVRVGFGGGVRFYSRNAFIARILIASTTQGGFTFNLLLHPIFGAAPQRP